MALTEMLLVQIWELRLSLLSCVCLFPLGTASAERFYYDVTADFETTDVSFFLMGGYTNLAASVTHTGEFAIPLVSSDHYILHSVEARLQFNGMSYSSEGDFKAWHGGGVHYSVESPGLFFSGTGHQYSEFGNGAGGVSFVDDDMPRPTLANFPGELSPSAFLYNPDAPIAVTQMLASYRGVASANGGFGTGPFPFWIGGSAAAGLTSPRLTVRYDLEELPGAGNDTLPTGFDYAEEVYGHVLQSEGEDLFAVETSLPSGLHYSGDYDNNAVVNIADYGIWRNSFGSTNAPNADGNGDGVVDAADYAVWRNNLGGGLEVTLIAETNSATSAVPEPSPFLITLLGMLSSLVNGHRHERPRAAHRAVA